MPSQKPRRSRQRDIENDATWLLPRSLVPVSRSNPPLGSPPARDFSARTATWVGGSESRGGTRKGLGSGYRETPRGRGPGLKHFLRNQSDAARIVLAAGRPFPPSPCSAGVSGVVDEKSATPVVFDHGAQYGTIGRWRGSTSQSRDLRQSS